MDNNDWIKLTADNKPNWGDIIYCIGPEYMEGPFTAIVRRNYAGNLEAMAHNPAIEGYNVENNVFSLSDIEYYILLPGMPEKENNYE